MNKIEYALKLAKDCTYADEMTESAKEHLRNKIDEALEELVEASGRVHVNELPVKFDAVNLTESCAHILIFEAKNGAGNR